MAFAAVGLDGKVLLVRSKRSWDADSLIREISAFLPQIIACDTNPPSKFARKLSTAMGCRLFVPLDSLTVREKYKLTEKHNYRNAHERDALAAAKKAYHNIENKMRQVEKLHRRKGGAASLEEVRRRVAQGRKMKEAIN